MKSWRWMLFMAGLVALYLGLILTGMTWPYLAAAPLAMAALMLYTVLMRPVAQWSGGGKLGLTLIVLAVLAALLTGAGSGLASVAGVPPLPIWSGPVLAFGGLGIARLTGIAAKAAEMDAFLDEAIAGIEAKSREIKAEIDAAPELPRMDSLPEEEQAVLRAALERLAALPNLPPDAEPPPGWAESMNEIIEPLEDKYLWQAAMAELAAADWLHLPNVEARALLALRPYVADKAFGQLLSHDAMLSALNSGSVWITVSILAQAERTMDLMPMFWREMPEPQGLRRRADRDYAGTPAEAPLRNLADRVERLEAEDRAEAEAGGNE